MTDMELVKQKTKTVGMRLEVVDDLYNVVAELQGKIVEINFTVDSESDIRFTAFVGLHATSDDEMISQFSEMWLDRMIRIYYGIFDDDEGDYRWWKLGSCLVSSNGYAYDAQNRRVNLQLVDMMAGVTEICGSPYGTDVLVPADSTIRDVLAATVAEFSAYKRCNITGLDDLVPNDLEYARGTYPYETLAELVALYPPREHYYDKDGVYTARETPTCMSDPVVITADEMAQLVIGENGQEERSNIHNVSEVWGKELIYGYTAEDCDDTTTAGTYALTLHSTVEVLEDQMTIGFTPNVDSVINQKLKVNGIDGEYLIYKEAGDGTRVLLAAGDIKADRTYVVKHIMATDTTAAMMVLQGETEIHAICMEFNAQPTDAVLASYKARWDCDNIRCTINPDSPYGVDKIGVYKAVYQDEDYANIYTTELALERAAYENWKTTRMQDIKTIECLFVPWIEVNQKIEYTSIATGETHQYLVQAYQVGDVKDGTMQMTIRRFYPYYPWLS